MFKLLTILAAIILSTLWISHASAKVDCSIGKKVGNPHCGAVKPPAHAAPEIDAAAGAAALATLFAIGALFW